MTTGSPPPLGAPWTGGAVPPGTDLWGTPRPTAPAGPPTRIRIPGIGVDSSLEDLRLDAAGVLTPPKDFGRAGWYVDGTAPGDVGPAVIAGHVDSRTGPAVFFKLRQVRPGDRVEVLRGGRWLAFRVLRVATYPKRAFPTDEVYRPTPLPELRLITCGGDFDAAARSYVDNVVAYAVAV